MTDRERARLIYSRNLERPTRLREICASLIDDLALDCESRSDAAYLRGLAQSLRSTSPIALAIATTPELKQ